MTGIGKRYICLLLVLLMLTGLAACGKKETQEENPNDIEVSETLSGETLTAGAAAGCSCWARI